METQTSQDIIGTTDLKININRQIGREPLECFDPIGLSEVIAIVINLDEEYKIKLPINPQIIQYLLDIQLIDFNCMFCLRGLLGCCQPHNCGACKKLYDILHRPDVSGRCNTAALKLWEDWKSHNNGKTYYTITFPEPKPAPKKEVPKSVLKKEDPKSDSKWIQRISGNNGESDWLYPKTINSEENSQPIKNPFKKFVKDNDSDEEKNNYKKELENKDKEIKELKAQMARLMTEKKGEKQRICPYDDIGCTSDKCILYHPRNPTKPINLPCRFDEVGKCKNGENCRYKHKSRTSPPIFSPEFPNTTKKTGQFKFGSPEDTESSNAPKPNFSFDSTGKPNDSINLFNYKFDGLSKTDKGYEFTRVPNFNTSPNEFKFTSPPNSNSFNSPPKIDPQQDSSFSMRTDNHSHRFPIDSTKPTTVLLPTNTNAATNNVKPTENKK